MTIYEQFKIGIKNGTIPINKKEFNEMFVETYFKLRAVKMFEDWSDDVIIEYSKYKCRLKLLEKYGTNGGTIPTALAKTR